MFEKQAKVVESTRPDQNYDDFIEAEGLIFIATAIATALGFSLFIGFIVWMLI